MFTSVIKLYGWLDFLLMLKTCLKTKTFYLGNTFFQREQTKPTLNKQKIHMRPIINRIVVTTTEDGTLTCSINMKTRHTH